MAECTLLMKELTGAATNIGSSALEAIEAGKGGETLAASLIACSKHFRAGASAVIAHMKNNPVCQSDPEFMQRLQDTSTHMDDYLNSIEHMGESLLS